MADQTTNIRILRNHLSRMEKELMESERRYRMMVENAADVMWTVDMNMVLTYVSPNIVRLLGYTVDEAISRRMDDVFTGDSYKKAMHVLSEELKRDTVNGVDKARSRALELDLIHKDGSMVPVEIKYSFIRDGQGIPREILAVVRNISERKQAEEQVLYEKSFLSDVLDCLPGIFYILDENANLVRWNKNEENVIGYSRKELHNMNAMLTIAEEDRALVAERLGEAFREGHSSVIANAITKNGVRKPFYLTGTKISKGGRNMLVGMGIDMSEQRQSEEQLKKSLEEVKESMEGAIAAIAMITEMRDPYTAGHQRRVAVLASSIAQDMGLSEEQVSIINMAGTLHDVGKSAIPMEILCKPVALDPMEFDIIKMHPRVGHDVLKLLKLPDAICPCVLQHHERMNGSGYPKGLAGDSIMMEARILAVADVVEAMSSDRPYRPSLGVGKALEEIVRNKEILYDARVADTCLMLFNEKGFKFD
jgi:PAS domain S-box-containing protein